MACVRRGSNRVSVREWAGCVGSSRFRKEARRVLSPPAPRGRRRARRQARPHLSIGWPARCRTSPAAAPAPRPAAPPAQRADRWKPRTGSGWRRPRQPRRRQRSGSSGSAFVSERQSQCWVGAFDARRTDVAPPEVALRPALHHAHRSTYLGVRRPRRLVALQPHERPAERGLELCELRRAEAVLGARQVAHRLTGEHRAAARHVHEATTLAGRACAAKHRAPAPQDAQSARTDVGQGQKRVAPRDVAPRMRPVAGCGACYERLRVVNGPWRAPCAVGRARGHRKGSLVGAHSVAKLRWLGVALATAGRGVPSWWRAVVRARVSFRFHVHTGGVAPLRVAARSAVRGL